MDEHNPRYAHLNAAMEKFGGFEFDPAKTYWGNALPVLERIDAALDVLDDNQREHLNALRCRIDHMSPREAAFVTGLLTECIGVAGAESGGGQ